MSDLVPIKTKGYSNRTGKDLKIVLSQSLALISLFFLSLEALMPLDWSSKAKEEWSRATFNIVLRHEKVKWSREPVKDMQLLWRWTFLTSFNPEIASPSTGLPDVETPTY
ncbi:hypothetical protein OIO90_004601 [Microbotryomycetes sp. JL221]|nr:hypothetical protein OIO90_004601 [Microbotryomycetes sp. JL221]